MQKRVNVIANIPVLDLRIPIRGSVRNIMMDVEDIRTCLFRKAKVEEIIAEDVVVKLDFTNYDKDNSGATPVAEPTPVIEEPAPAPVAEEKVEEVVEETAEEPKEEVAEPESEENAEEEQPKKANKKKK